MSDIKIFADSPEDEAVDQIYELANKVYELINQAAPEDAEIKMISNSNTTKIDMSGLDKDTEILTPNGWLKIAKYNDNTTYISFYADHLRHKSLTDLYYANANQLKIIAEESLLWDGYKGYRSSYYTTQKDEADFIQYAFNASGTRASIYEFKETKKGKEHYSKCYSVIPTRNEYVAYCQPVTVNSEDGYKYCFTTSTGFFIARRNKHIFITGDCPIVIKI